VFVEGGACATAQWHNGQSKPDGDIGFLRESDGLNKRAFRDDSVINLD